MFLHSPLREVAFELRFPPRLRVPAEIWRLQDQLVQAYPEVGKEATMQATGAVSDVAVFQNSEERRVIKVSHSNFVIAFTRYVRFDDFKSEVLRQTEQFCGLFGIEEFSRIGLRYVNEIALPNAEPLSKYLSPSLSFTSFPEELVDQFAVEVFAKYREHPMTVRSALLPGLVRTYVLDIDCHTSARSSAAEHPILLDRFHESAQRVFLDHVTEEYKQVMRGRK